MSASKQEPQGWLAMEDGTYGCLARSFSVATRCHDSEGELEARRQAAEGGKDLTKGGKRQKGYVQAGGRELRTRWSPQQNLCLPPHSCRSSSHVVSIHISMHRRLQRRDVFRPEKNALR